MMRICEHVHDAPTMTAGELRDVLSRLPDDTPVLGLKDGWYLNVEGVEMTDEDIAANIIVTDDYDTRQW